MKTIIIFIFSVFIHSLFFLALHVEFQLREKNLVRRVGAPVEFQVAQSWDSSPPEKAPDLESQSSETAKRPKELEAPKENLEGVKKELVLGTASGDFRGVSGDQGEGQLKLKDQYLLDFTDFIQSQLVYPRSALRLRQTGRIMIRFRIAADGRVIESEVIEKCPFESLNRAATKLTSNIRQFRPLPVQEGQVAWDILVPLEYVIE